MGPAKKLILDGQKNRKAKWLVNVDWISVDSKASLSASFGLESALDLTAGNALLTKTKHPFICYPGDIYFATFAGFVTARGKFSSEESLYSRRRDPQYATIFRRSCC